MPNLSDLRNKLGADVVDLRDWSIDLTGTTDMTSVVQAWQDQAVAARKMAYAPAGIIRLDSKVNFKAPTMGAGGVTDGRIDRVAPTGSAVTYTEFRNGGINDGSWLIDCITDNTFDPGNKTFKYLGNFRVSNANYGPGGADGPGASLIRIKPPSAGGSSSGATNSLYENLVLYGGYVNMQIMGHNVILRNIHSAFANVSAMRCYESMMLIVEGGHYWGNNENAWAFEYLSRDTASTFTFGEHACGVSFHEVFFQPDQDNDASAGYPHGPIDGQSLRFSNGLRISERTSHVYIKAYFEGFGGKDDGSGGVALEVGLCNGFVDEGATIPIVIDPATNAAHAATNELRHAVEGVVLNMTGQDITINTEGNLLHGDPRTGPRYRFGNISGLRWETGSRVVLGRVEYSGYTRSISGVPQCLGEPTPRIASSSGAAYTGGGTTTTTSYPAATTVMTVVDASEFTVGREVWITLNAPTNKAGNYFHKATLTNKTVTPSHTLTISPAIPAGRSVPSGAEVAHNRLERPTFHSRFVYDGIERGSSPSVNLIPYQFPRGSTDNNLRGIKTIVVNGNPGSVGWEWGVDTAVTFRGRPTLKFTLDPALSYTNPTLFARIEAFPHGTANYVKVGAPIVFAGWYMLENAGGFASTDSRRSAACSFVNATNTITFTYKHNLIDDLAVSFAAVPSGAGITAGVTYYAIVVDVNTIRIATTRGGGAVTGPWGSTVDTTCTFVDNHFDYPSVGVVWSNGGTTRYLHSVLGTLGSSADASGHAFGQPCGEWQRFLCYAVVEADHDEVGFVIAPTSGYYDFGRGGGADGGVLGQTGTLLTGGAYSCWFADLVLSVNPRDMHSLLDGDFIYAPESGLFTPTGQLEIPGAAAPGSVSYINYAVGDKVLNTAPDAGGSVGWVYTSSGWKEFGAIEV